MRRTPAVHVAALMLFVACAGEEVIAPSVATQLVVTSAPSAAPQNRIAFAAQPVVQLRDASGVAVAKAGVVVTVAITAGGGTLSGTTTATTSSTGAATFVGLSIAGTVGARTLTFTADGLSSAATTLTLAAGVPTSMVIAAGNSQSGIAGAAVATAPAVTIADADGNGVSGVSVTFAVASGNGAATGATQTTNASGAAAIGGWMLGSTVGANTLTAAATGLTTVTFTATGTAGPAAKLVVTTAPSASVPSAAVFAVQPTVQLQDANSNTVSSANVAVTAAISAGGGTLGGTASAATVANGSATFTSLAITGATGTRTLTFSATGLTSAAAQVTVTVGSATAIALNLGNGQSATAGIAVATAPSVIVTDAGGNGVANAAVTFAVASGGGAATGTTATTSASGIATVGSWTLGTTAATNTLTATAAGLTGSPVTFTATGTAGGAATITKIGADPTTLTPGATFGDSVRVFVADVNGNARSGVVVSFAVTAGGGSISPPSATTDAAGKAAARFTTGASSGTNTATATVTGLTPLSFTIATTPPPVATVTVGPDSSGVPITATMLMAVTLKDAGGATLTGRNTTWQSSNTSVATVTNGGVITAVGIGITTLTATAEGQSGTAKLSVEALEPSLGGHCALVVTGAAYCWGGNQDGQAGVGFFSTPGNTSTYIVVPTAVVGGLKFRQISGNEGHVMALTADGTAYGWGLNRHGQLGIGDTTARTAPIAVATALKFKSIVVWGDATLAITADGTPYAWGRVNQFDPVGVGDGLTSGTKIPVAVAGGFKFAKIAGGSNAAYGITASGQAYAWGHNENGQIGDGTNTNRTTPTLMSGGLTFASISGGGQFALGLTTGGTAYSWGDNFFGMLGDGTRVSRSTPGLIAGGQSFAMLSGGGTFAYGLTASGAAYAWGSNVYGEQANGLTDNNAGNASSYVLTPVAILGGLTFRSIGSISHAFAITIGGTGYSWGFNGQGGVGDGTRTHRLEPTLVSGGLVWKR